MRCIIWQVFSNETMKQSKFWRRFDKNKQREFHENNCKTVFVIINGFSIFLEIVNNIWKYNWTFSKTGVVQYFFEQLCTEVESEHHCSCNSKFSDFYEVNLLNVDMRQFLIDKQCYRSDRLCNFTFNFYLQEQHGIFMAFQSNDKV